jgi:DNA-binding MarR family transcriptional regulator
MPSPTGQVGSPGCPGDTRGGDGQFRLFRLVRFSHIFASAVREILELKFLRETAPWRLTLLQFHLLKLISLNGQRQVGELAHCLGVTPPAATKNIDKLERLGLAVRTPCTGDRRATLLSASAKGRRLVRKYEDVKAARLVSALKGFQPEDIERFSDLLERFSVSLLSLEQSEREFCLRCAAYIENSCPVGQIRGGCCPYQRNRGAGGSAVTAEEAS